MGSTLSTGPPAPAASKISTGWFAVLTGVQCDCAMAAEQRFVGIGKKNSSKVVAPPGGKSSIGFGEPEEALKPLLPKNSSSAAKARDLSTNFMAAEDPSKSSGGDSSSKGEDESKPEAPRPKGAPNRAKHPPGGASHGSLW